MMFASQFQFKSSEISFPLQDLCSSQKSGLVEVRGAHLASEALLVNI